MVIAVTKATLVILFFMHLRYDRLFHTVVFVSAICAASLFVGLNLMDRSQDQYTNIPRNSVSALGDSSWSACNRLVGGPVGSKVSKHSQIRFPALSWRAFLGDPACLSEPPISS